MMDSLVLSYHGQRKVRITGKTLISHLFDLQIKFFIFYFFRLNFKSSLRKEDIVFSQYISAPNLFLLVLNMINHLT